MSFGSPADTYVGVSLFLTSLFSLTALKILSLTFGNLNISQCSPVWVQHIYLLGLMDLDIYFSPKVWEVFSHCFIYAFCPFIFSFWDLHNAIIFSFVSHNCHKLFPLSIPFFFLFP